MPVLIHFYDKPALYRYSSILHRYVYTHIYTYLCTYIYFPEGMFTYFFPVIPSQLAITPRRSTIAFSMGLGVRVLNLHVSWQAKPVKEIDVLVHLMYCCGIKSFIVDCLRLHLEGTPFACGHSTIEIPALEGAPVGASA